MAPSRGLTRRDLLRAGAAAGALAGLEALAPAKVLDRVLAAPVACGRLSDIEHVVIFINENRSFDSYFGTYRGVRGFGDPNVLKLGGGSSAPIFAQPFPGAAGAPYGGHLLPFHFDTSKGGECVNDISHEWAALHQCWDGGALDSFVSVHVDPTVNGTRDGPNTMGYYTREDLPFFHALADNFTICDGYFCSVIGPTDPNRLYSMSATIDPAGKNGGPSLQTLVTNRAQQYGKFTWPTYPEQLQAHGISWKVYATPDGNYGDNVLPYFKAYQQNPQLAANALTPTFPADFQADCAAGTLPQVSWGLASLAQSEHPPAPVTYGEAALSQVLQALTSNPVLWAKTALFATYDENGGFFDHVPPPVPQAGTPGESLHRRTPAEHRRWHPRADRVGLQGADARPLAVLARGLRVLRYLRPHLALAVPGDALRPGGPQPERLATVGYGRSHERVQLREAGRVGSAAPPALNGGHARAEQRLSHPGSRYRQRGIPDGHGISAAPRAADDARPGTGSAAAPERLVSDAPRAWLSASAFGRQLLPATPSRRRPRPARSADAYEDAPHLAEWTRVAS
jgi:phospholipase C